MKRFNILIGIVGISAFLSGCNAANNNAIDDIPTASPETVIVEEKDTDTEDKSDVSSLFIKSPAGSTSKEAPYTKGQLESDPKAPSTNINDYNSDGEYVPEGGISDNPSDYNANGEYKPIEEMTQEEMRIELEAMLESALE
ncbi:hypothetical protein [Paenibacillus luteus]|uniref:hypothetical protein n=1 Tax=Paenibacillus luteus TaxID=2545753 RepID=UPI001142D2E7|nr:hypothetical protein [Paenibacillus luteus]